MVPQVWKDQSPLAKFSQISLENFGENSGKIWQDVDGNLWR